jgi:hypothetical protein
VQALPFLVGLPNVWIRWLAGKLDMVPVPVRYIQSNDALAQQKFIFTQVNSVSVSWGNLTSHTYTHDDLGRIFSRMVAPFSGAISDESTSPDHPQLCTHSKFDTASGAF